MSWPKNSPDNSVSDEQWADWQNRFGEQDQTLGFELSRDFKPFAQVNDMFTRAFWDENVKSDDALGFFKSYGKGAVPRRGQGFSQKDFALRNAAWIISDIISGRGAETGEREGFQAPIAADTPVAQTKADIAPLDEQSAEIKHLAKMFGADLVGITEVDERWHYASRVDMRDMSEAENALPDGITHVIIMGHSMDFDLVDTYPSALAGVSTGREYSHEAAICIQLASYIRNLGYEAVASMNDTALTIPYAIKAGLGEYGRNQMVLTREFGPRVRFSKIFTSLPLKVDVPDPLGLTRYCHECTVCADACPPKALPKGEPDFGPSNISTISGVKKWSADCEKCFGYWAKLKTDCAICMRVCPFNRRYDRVADRIWRWLATSRWYRLGKWWADKQGVRKRLKPGLWWADVQK